MNSVLLAGCWHVSCLHRALEAELLEALAVHLLLALVVDADNWQPVSRRVPEDGRIHPPIYH